MEADNRPSEISLATLHSSDRHLGQKDIDVKVKLCAHSKCSCLLGRVLPWNNGKTIFRCWSPAGTWDHRGWSGGSHPTTSDTSKLTSILAVLSVVRWWLVTLKLVQSFCRYTVYKRDITHYDYCLFHYHTHAIHIYEQTLFNFKNIQLEQQINFLHNPFFIHPARWNVIPLFKQLSKTKAFF